MNKNYLIIAIAVIIIAILGIFALTNQETQDGTISTQIEFLSESTLKNGEPVQFVLKDDKNNPLPGQNITIIFVENGENQTYSIVTDNEGKGALVINNENEGKYDVIVSYNGTKLYNPCSAKQTITVEAEHVDAGSIEPLETNSSAGTALYNNQNSSDTQLHYDNQYNFYYDDNGIIRGGQNDGYSADYIRNIYQSGEMVDEEGNLQ